MSGLLVRPDADRRHEVIQGATSATDAITDKEIGDAAALRATLLESEKLSAELKEKARGQMTEPAKIEVHVGSGNAGVGS